MIEQVRIPRAALKLLIVALQVATMAGVGAIAEAHQLTSQVVYAHLPFLASAK